MYNRMMLGLAALTVTALVSQPATTVARATATTPLILRPNFNPQLASFVPLPAPRTDGPELTAAGEALLSSIPASPFGNWAPASEDGQRALNCLTDAVYYEARSEPLDGQRAVAQVVLNRVRNPAFPKSICGVVFQGSERSTGCQFTFTCDGSMLAPREQDAWERSRMVAANALAGDVYEPVGLATSYHTTAILPWWASSLSRVAQIGSHIFYRWPGLLGSTLSFNQPYSGIEPAGLDHPGGVASFQTAGQQLLTFGNATVAIHRGEEAGEGVAIHHGEQTGDRIALQGSSSAVHIHYNGRDTAHDAAPAASGSSVGGVRIHIGPNGDQPNAT